MRILAVSCLWILLLRVSPIGGVVEASANADQPQNKEQWVRPNNKHGFSLPIWGHADGLRVGLAPLPGPRGLLRIYAPYLDQPYLRVINFIAVEPIAKGSKDRGLSELEHSRLDKMMGKRFWGSNEVNNLAPKLPIEPAGGWIEEVDGDEQLFVYVLIEPFENGAHVYLRLRFRASRPHEVGIATFAHKDSIPLEHCIVTATMGNYARLRHLQLADRVVKASKLWPNYQGDGFTPHARFPLSELIRSPEGHALAVAVTDEKKPQLAEYAPGTRSHWKYVGLAGLQSWMSIDPDSRLEVWVNGRRTYWNSQDMIPGGIAFENFEMVSPFRQGEEFIFSVEPLEMDASSKERVH